MINTRHNARITGFLAALAIGHIGDEKFLIKKELAEQVVGNMDDHTFMNASAEAREAGELSNGYDLMYSPSENFYCEHRILALELIETTIMKVRYPNSNESLLACVMSMIDEHIYPLVKPHHVKKVLEGYLHKDTDDEAAMDAFDIVSYQVVSHCIMETCYAYNTYLDYLSKKAA